MTSYRARRAPPKGDGLTARLRGREHRVLAVAVHRAISWHGCLVNLADGAWCSAMPAYCST